MLGSYLFSCALLGLEQVYFSKEFRVQALFLRLWGAKAAAWSKVMWPTGLPWALRVWTLESSECTWSMWVRKGGCQQLDEHLGAVRKPYTRQMCFKCRPRLPPLSVHLHLCLMRHCQSLWGLKIHFIICLCIEIRAVPLNYFRVVQNMTRSQRGWDFRNSIPVPVTLCCSFSSLPYLFSQCNQSEELARQSWPCHALAKSIKPSWSESQPQVLTDDREKTCWFSQSLLLYVYSAFN